MAWQPDIMTGSRKPVVNLVDRPAFKASFRGHRLESTSPLRRAIAVSVVRRVHWRKNAAPGVPGAAKI